MVDYKRLAYHNNTNFAICPNCGELIATTYQDDDDCRGDEDEACISYNYWYKCRCSKCKISGDGSRSSNFSLKDPIAWKFPKNYKITSTQKQNNYIKFLATELGLNYNYISNKEVASNIIKELHKIYVEKEQKKIFEYNIIKCFDDTWQKTNTEGKYFNFKKDLESTESVQVKMNISILKEDPKKVTFNYELTNISRFDLSHNCNMLQIAFKEFIELKSKLEKIKFPTYEKAEKEIDKEKELYKKNCLNISDEADYDSWCDPDFSELC